MPQAEDLRLILAAPFLADGHRYVDGVFWEPAQAGFVAEQCEALQARF